MIIVSPIYEHNYFKLLFRNIAIKKIVLFENIDNSKLKTNNNEFMQLKKIENPLSYIKK